MEYPKIETLWNRDPHDMKLVLAGDFRCEEFGLVDKWLITEKVDGTNVRVFLNRDRPPEVTHTNGPTVHFGGRTDNAQMPMLLIDFLQRTFPDLFLADVFDPGAQVILYGEGYGLGIQNGGGYRPDISFRLFDVVVRDITRDHNWWLNWPDVQDIAKKLGIETVPVIGQGSMTLGEAVQNF